MAVVSEIPVAKAHEPNIEKVLQLEAEQEKLIAPANRISEAIGKFAGTNSFVFAQIVGVGAWISLNSGLLGEPFDPYPFVFLGMLLALEAVLLTSFVLIRQNRMSQKADQRAHLDLQINLLAEKEITKVIQLLHRMSAVMGIEQSVTDEETRALSKDTEVEEVARDIKENLVDEG
jgi:uncharacterized membrane protein